MPERCIAFLDLGSIYRSELSAGIQNYLRDHGPWRLLSEDQWEISHEDLPRPPGVDGLIVDTYRRTGIIGAVRAGGLPCVDVNPASGESPLPNVLPANAEVGRLAAAHLLERGFKRLAFCGPRLFRFAQERQAGFQQFAHEHGLPVDVFAGPAPWDRGGAAWEREVAAWLATLPKPVGLMLAMDSLYGHLLKAAARDGLRVPDDLAVIGVDNNRDICDNSRPALSSVPLDFVAIGFRACALLTDLMDGCPPPSDPPRVAPRPVVSRRSTDMLAIADEDVAAAVRYIRAHSHQEVTVEDVLDAVPVSRRSLEMRFKNEMGRTIQKDIWQAHIERARRLLTETNWSMPEVAKKAGFLSAQRMSEVFRKHAGQSPSACRRQSRQNPFPGASASKVDR